MADATYNTKSVKFWGTQREQGSYKHTVTGRALLFAAFIQSFGNARLQGFHPESRNCVIDGFRFERGTQDLLPDVRRGNFAFGVC